jgi:hypothetical protein
MKRGLIVAFSILILCSLLLVVIAKAGNPAYSMMEYWADTPATIDGAWTTDTEWADGEPHEMSENATFAYKVDARVTGAYIMQWLVEIFTDNTDDAGDVWQICLDPDNGGGAAPQAGDFKIEIEGHTDLVCYEGNGAGWDVITPDAGEIEWDDSISDSPWNSTSHWILEIQLAKESGQILVGQPENGIRVAVYDDSDPSAGFQAWAPGSADVPDEWGVISGYSTTPWPEGFSFVVVVLLSSVAVVVGFYFLRKRPKTEGGSVGKTGEINYTR